MAFFYEWKFSALNEAVSELECLIKEADENAADELKAAINIQRIFRGKTDRVMIFMRREAEIVISRIYRGHLGRKVSLKLLVERHNDEECVLFHNSALRIQTCYRGYYSRKHKHDFSSRKLYLTNIADMGEKIRHKLNKRLELQIEEEAKKTTAENRKKFTSIAENMHHLLSTSCTPGIFSSQLHDQTAFGEPIEEHLRASTKSLLHSQSRKKRNLKVKPTPPKVNRSSIQASSKYGVVREKARMEKKYNKIKRVVSQDFITSSNKNSFDSNRKDNNSGNSTINEESTAGEYLDTWDNPFFKRGIPTNKDDFDPKLSTIDKAPKIPFYVTSGGNKNKVLANDRFDV